MPPAWRHPLRNHIDRLKDIRSKLGSPAEFYTGHEAEYAGVAKRLTAAVLAAAKPAEMETAAWMFQVNVFAESVGTTLVNAEWVGLSIFLDSRQWEQMRFDEDFAAGTFAKDTVLKWVRAGRAEDPLGKQLDERDAGDSDETIAARVWWAIYTRRSLHSAEHIRNFMEGKARLAVRAAMPSVLAAWKQTLHVLVRKDWSAWVAGAIKKPR